MNKKLNSRLELISDLELDELENDGAEILRIDHSPHKLAVFYKGIFMELTYWKMDVLVRFKLWNVTKFVKNTKLEFVELEEINLN